MDDNTALASAPSLRASLVGAFMARTQLILLGAVTVAIILKYLLIFRINIHWDEFYFLSFVHDYARGTLDARFQTFHVHFFSWLTGLGMDEIGEILVARVVMATLASASALLTYGIVRRFASREAALFGVLAYLSVSVVVDTGASFRVDTIVTFLALSGVYSLLRPSCGWIGAAIAGFAMGLAALVTIKIAMYLPVVAAVIWCSASQAHRVRLALAFSMAFAATFGALYSFHAASLTIAPQIGAASFLGSTASKALLEDGIFPRWLDFLIIVGQNPFFFVMAWLGGRWAWRNRRGRDAWLPLALALPLLTPLVYRNAYAYYYVFILPLAAVLVALFYDERRRMAVAEPTSPAPRVLAMIVIAYCFVLGFYAHRSFDDKIAPQRTVLAAVHHIFTAPVPYIDGFGVVASFPRYGFFMSSWGMHNYQQAGNAYYPSLVAQAQPPLLLADSPSLYAAVTEGVIVTEERSLLPEDIRFLQDNYVQHWGMVYVAGKRLRMGSDGDRATFDVAIAGNYRLEAAIPVVIDGTNVAPGDSVMLQAGSHWFRPDRTVSDATLRWANAMMPPAVEPVGLFTFFGEDR
jgi:hypothetical protein